MRSKPLRPYLIGFSILGLLLVSLVLFLVLQAGKVQQDAQTFKSATSIAYQLNDATVYGTVPDSLGAAGIHSVPKSITYRKLSTDKYQFCVAYKASGTVVSSNLTAQVLSRVTLGPMADDATSETYLNIPASHHSGENCQTIKATNGFSNDTGTDSSQISAGSGVTDNSSAYTNCGQPYNYSWAVLNVTSLTPQKGSTDAVIGVDSTTNSTFQLDPQVKVFDKNCNPLTLGDIHVGDMIDLYFNPYGAPVTMLIKEY